MSHEMGRKNMFHEKFEITLIIPFQYEAGHYNEIDTFSIKWCGIKKLTAYSQGFHNKTKRISRYSKWHVNMTMNTKYRQ